MGGGVSPLLGSLVSKFQVEPQPGTIPGRRDKEHCQYVLVTLLKQACQEDLVWLTISKELS